MKSDTKNIEQYTLCNPLSSKAWYLELLALFSDWLSVGNHGHVLTLFKEGPCRYNCNLITVDQPAFLYSLLSGQGH